MTRIGGGAGAPDWYQPEGVDTNEIKASLDDLRKYLKASRDDDGRVDVSELEACIDASGDPALREQLDEILGAFQRTVTYRSGCGSATRQQDPKTLGRGDVQRVLRDITAAKRELGKLDANDDGVLTEREMAESDGDFSSQLLEATLAARLDEAREAEEAAVEPEPEPTSFSSGCGSSAPPPSTFRSGCS